MKKTVLLAILSISLSNIGAAQALIEDVSVAKGFDSGRAYLALDDFSDNLKIVSASYRLEQREECGAGNGYRQLGSGQLNFVNSVAYVDIDEQSFVQDKIGLVYSITLNDGAQNRVLNGVLCR